MGFNLVRAVSRWEAVEALIRFAFRALGCLHLEFTDRRLEGPAPRNLRLASSPQQTFELDLSADEDVIFGRMTSACRRAIRKAEKSGVRVEEASGLEFADEYYAQLVDVFEKQSLTPTYGVERVRELIRCLEPTGRLLLLRAVAPSGERIATGIFPAMNGTAYFWGGASWRQQQILRPNEAIFWYAMRYWKARGTRALDMGGGGEYKRKYGPVEFDVPSFRRSRIPGLTRARDVAKYLKTRRY
jgi:predicted N-acyltransferase